MVLTNKRTLKDLFHLEMVSNLVIADIYFSFLFFGLTLIAFDNKGLIKKQKHCIKHIHLKTDDGFVCPKQFLQNEKLFLFTFQKMVLK